MLILVLLLDLAVATPSTDLDLPVATRGDLPPRIPQRGTVEWRALHKALSRYCKKHPTSACKYLLPGLAGSGPGEQRRGDRLGDNALEVDLWGDQLVINVVGFSDSWPQAWFEWTNGRWVPSRVGWFSMW